MNATIHRIAAVGIICILSSILAACASSPVPPSQAAPVVQKRIFAPSAWLHSCNNCGKIIVTRDDGTMVAAAVTITVRADHERVAALLPGTRIVFYLPAGHHTVSIGGPDTSATLPMTLRAGETNVYRIAISGGFFGQIVLEPFKNTPKSR